MKKICEVLFEKLGKINFMAKIKHGQLENWPTFTKRSKVAKLPHILCIDIGMHLLPRGKLDSPFCKPEDGAGVMKTDGPQ